YWRFVRGQLLWPVPARYDLHVVAEQVPTASNRISLSPLVDTFGTPLAEITWHVNELETATIAAFARRFGLFWRRHGFAGIATLRWVMGRDNAAGILSESVSGMYHPGGTTRMSFSPRVGVVNRDLNVFAVPNLSVASTSVFPSGASANPTMMLMAFCLRL